MSGPEGSSTKRCPSSAAERPGLSRLLWKMRERPIDGGCTAQQFGQLVPVTAIAGRSVVTQATPHQAIYRRWRAQTFGQIVGQQAVVDTLRNAVRTGRTHHAYLFVGPRGTGKTSMARILAKALNCTNLRDGEPCDECPACVAIREGRALDVAEMDAASNNRVDDMRDLLPAHLHHALGPAGQGLHRRRGSAHPRGLGRAAQDARGAARPRRIRLLHDRQHADPPGGRVARPALRLPAPDRLRDRRQAANDNRGGRPDGRARGDRSDRPPGGRRHARRRVDARPAARHRFRDARRPPWCATCWAWWRRRRSTPSWAPWWPASR